MGGATYAAAAGKVVLDHAMVSAATTPFRIERVYASSMSAEDLQKVRDIRRYDSAGGLAYVTRGQVIGISCRKDFLGSAPELHWLPGLNGETPEEAAVTQLKRKALKAGGNAILSPVCSHNESIDWGNNCFESWICVAEAIHEER